MFFMLFIFINMGKIIFTMLYQKSELEPQTINEEKFELNHLVVIILLVMVTIIAVSSPEILYRNIMNIAKDYGMSL
ncbi:MAG: hypothetical protein A2279_08340 [Stygiobacter sp. RIFOXYA12_FULL_38_9]|nr:MAG: hypothetical protein A2279_08340 [Stygiobacter sp. RIFOXYA12_FULL_38_9]